MNRTIASLVAALVIGACETVASIDSSTHGRIRGVVVNQANIPQDSAVITVLGEGPAVGRLGQATTDATGRFELGIHIPLVGPGDHPISIAVGRGADADTVSGFFLRTFEQSPVPDTTEVEVIVP